MNTKPNHTKFIILTLLIVSFFNACKKEEVKTVTPAAPPKISFVNGIPAFSNLDFYVGATKTASITNGFSSPYVELAPGKKEISVNKTGGSEKLASSTVELKNGSGYLALLCGTASRAELLIAEHSYDIQNSGKARVRFINLSQSPGGLSLNIRGMQPSYTAQPYKRVTSFETMDPIYEISYEIRKQNEQAISASLEKAKLEAGKIYTLIAYDDSSSEGQTMIRLSILQNN